MTSLNTVSPANATADAAGAAAAKLPNTGELQDRFLTLLTAQMKNQDPLNPLDNAQLTTQIAQISTVAGVDKLNGTLKEMMKLFSSTQALQAASLVGRGVLAPGAELALGQAGAVGGVSLDGPADRVLVEILDAAGVPLDSVDLGPQAAGVAAFHWDGKTDHGAAPQGSYTFRVSATRGGAKVAAEPLAAASVQGVSPNASGVSLRTDRLGVIDYSSVKQIL